jgi:predicted alpha/beta superfamily hydrolase
MAPVESRRAQPASAELKRARENAAGTRVLIHHPRAADCGVRLDDDWGVVHRPTPVNAHVSAFDLPSLGKRPSVFKVTLGNEWAVGPNVTIQGKEVHVTPTFTRGSGSVRTLFGGFWSNTLQNHRDVRVYHPPGYDENPERRYPVVYFHDGQNVFTGHGAQPFGTWAAEKALDHLIGSGRIAPVIAIGVDNIGDRRRAEYGPEQGAQYLHFLAHELKREVDKWLRTKADAHHVAVVGSSLGGWISLFGAHTQPALGNKVGALSTAAWLQQDLLANRIRRGELDLRPLQAPNARTWLDFGIQDRDPKDAHDDIDNGRGNRVLWDVYASKGLKNGNANFKTTIVPIPHGQAPHSEASWAQRLGDVLAYLTEPWNAE